METVTDKEICQLEKIPTNVFATSMDGSKYVAQEIAKLIKEKANAG